MRNLKRALSLGLASVMVIGMMATGAGAVSYDDLTDRDQIVNQEAVQMLVEVGVIEGKDDGTYDPTGIVTRAEMATIICRILNGGSDPNLGTTTVNSYTDTVGHWASGYIEYCTQLGIVAGDGTGRFNPSATVTGAEAAKMLLVALGYNATYENMVGASWAVATNVLANQNGLYDGLSINPSEGLTRDNTAQMAYNALDARMVTYDYAVVPSGDSISAIANAEQTDRTLLEDKFNAVKVEGIVVANEYATLSSTADEGSALDEGKTRVVITNGGADEDQNVYTGTTTFNVTTGQEELGRSVILYVENANNANNADVFGSAIESGENLVIKDTSTDTIKEVADDNDLDFDADAQIAYNYGGAEDLTDVNDEFRRGTEKYLIDNDDDGDVDYVLVNTMYFGQVSRYSTRDDGSITINIGNAWNGSDLTSSDSADVVGFDDVAEDDYVMAGWIGGKLYVSHAESVTGTLESLRAGDRVTVDGTTYDISEVPGYSEGDDSIIPATQLGRDNLDNEATFYLDANGLVVAAGDVAENAGNYAYVWAVDEGGNLDDTRVKVTLQDGTTATYNLDSDSEDGVFTEDAYSTTVGDEIRVFAYTLDDDTITLTYARNGNASIASTDFTKGRADVGDFTDKANVEEADQTDYASSSTIFFYVDLDKDDAIDDVDVYTGYSNAPSVDGVAAEAAYNAAGNMAAVALTGGTLSTRDLSDFLYVTDIVSESSDYTTVEAILAGTNEVVEINVTTSIDDHDVDKVFLFSVDDEGNYELEDVTGEDEYLTGVEVLNITGNNVVITDAEASNDRATYESTDETMWVEQEDGQYDTVSLGSLPANRDRATVHTMLVNNDDEILVIVTNVTTTEEPEEPEEPTEGEPATITLADLGYRTGYTFFVNGSEVEATTVPGGMSIAAEVGDTLTIENATFENGTQYTVNEENYTVTNNSISIEVTGDMSLTLPTLVEE